MVIFGALHVVALALGALLFYMFLRSDTTTNWRPPDEDDGGGGGGNDRLRPQPKPRKKFATWKPTLCGVPA